MKHMNICMRLVFLFAIALSAFAGTGMRGVAAQTPDPDGEVFVSEVTGIEIELESDWVLSGSEVIDDDGVDEESIAIQINNANVTIAFFNEKNADDSLDGFLAGFDSSAQSREHLDGDYVDGVAWSFDSATLGDGTDITMYSQVEEGLVEDYVTLSFLLAVPDDFLDGMGSAQAGVVIDGDAMFETVDLDALEEVLDNGVAVDRTGSTVEASAESVENGSETGQGGQGEADAPDFEELGLVDEGEYVSPQFNVGLTWDNNWSVDELDSNAVSSDTDTAMDSIAVTWDGEDYIVTYLDIISADGLDASDYVDYWLSDEFLAEAAEPEAEVRLDDVTRDGGTVLMLDYLSDGEAVYILREAICADVDCEFIVLATLIGVPGMFGDAYDDAEGGFLVEGEPVLTTFGAREIELAVDE